MTNTHGSPELDADAAKLEAMGADPGLTPDELFILLSTPPCEHEFGGWREFADGRGGEQFCAKCGTGAMEHSLRYCE